MTSSTDLLQQLDLPALSDSSDTDDFLQELVALNDAGLLRATVESLECGRLTPLIKEELRCRIQSRRLSEGKEELLVDFPSPTPAQPRPDEVEKRDRRREQNRRAAQKFRKKKKERGEHLIEETQRLECHNTTLRSEIRQLHEERDQLARIIQNHASVCPLTPHQSPLTIPRESPLPQHSGGSPLPPPPPPPPPPPSSSSNLPISSPIRKSPMLVQGSGYNASQSSRESPATVILLSPACGEHHASSISSATGRLIIASPVQMSGRPRKSPVPLLRPSQSPAPGEKSPVPLGSPRKQNKQSNLRLNLAGPKPVKPILPKGSLAIIQSCTSPKTPLGIITSPLPISQSPVPFGGRTLHQSPVFFGDGCFTPSASRNQYPNQSPISFTDSNSTPGHHVTQSPVFFGEKSPNVAFSCPNFVQPLSVSSTSSTSSLASLLRQESPSSVTSNSSGLSTASSVFLPGPNSSNNNNGCSNNNTNNNNNNNNNTNSNTNNAAAAVGEQNLSAFCPSSFTPNAMSMSERAQTNSMVSDSRDMNVDSNSTINNNNNNNNSSNNSSINNKGCSSNTNTFTSNLEGSHFSHYTKSLKQPQFECHGGDSMNVHGNLGGFGNYFPSPERRGCGSSGSLSDAPMMRNSDEPQTGGFRMDFSSSTSRTAPLPPPPPLPSLSGSLFSNPVGVDPPPSSSSSSSSSSSFLPSTQKAPQQTAASALSSGSGGIFSGEFQGRGGPQPPPPPAPLPLPLGYETASKHSAFSSNLLLPDSSTTTNPSTNCPGFGQPQEDNTLSVEDIERSVAAGESVDPLLDFIDIQELLGLNNFHNNSSSNNNNNNNNNNNSNNNNSSNSSGATAGGNGNSNNATTASSHIINNSSNISNVGNNRHGMDLGGSCLNSSSSSSSHHEGNMSSSAASAAAAAAAAVAAAAATANNNSSSSSNNHHMMRSNHDLFNDLSFFSGGGRDDDHFLTHSN